MKMFEKIVAFLLNKYLGKYVADLDSENLNVGVFSGTVQLTDLQLKPEALFELDLPIEVKAGSIGKLSIDIPWTTLYTEPVLVHIQDILIVVVPITDHNYDAEKEKRLLRARKCKILEKNQTTSIKNVPFESQSFFESILAQIIYNVQVSIENVHIRFEDTNFVPNCALSCGIAFQSLTAITTNSRWKPAQIDANVSKMFKLVKLETCYVYCNARCNPDKLVKNDLSSHLWKKIMKESIYNCSIFQEEFDFVLKPIIIKMKLIYNVTTEHRVPKLLVDCVLQDASVQLSEHQYQAIITIVDSFKRLETLRPFWKWRPLKPVKGNAKIWWKYAFNAIRDKFIRVYKWENIKQHRKNYHDYKKLYKEKLLHPNDAEIRVDLQKAEDKLDITNLMLVREETERELIKSVISLDGTESEDSESNESVSKFWIGKSKSTKSEIRIKSEQENLWSKLSPHEQKMLYEIVQSFGDSPLTESSVDIEECFAHKFNFTLANFTLTLITGEREIFVGSITQFLISCETRPSASGFKFSFRAESLLLEGANANELVPIITADGTLNTTNKNDIFSIDFEINPINLKAHYVLKAEVEPIEIVFHQQSINEIVSFFQIPSLVSAEEVKVLISQTFIKYINLCREKFIEYAIGKQSEFLFDVAMKSFFVVIPQEETGKKVGKKFVVDLGKLVIKSEA